MVVLKMSTKEKTLLLVVSCTLVFRKKRDKCQDPGRFAAVAASQTDIVVAHGSVSGLIWYLDTCYCVLGGKT